MKYVASFISMLLLSLSVLSQNTDTLKIKPFQISLDLERDSSRMGKELYNASETIRLIEEKKKWQKTLKDEGEPVFALISLMPRFPGGDQKMEQFIQKHLKYPKKAKCDKIEGVVVVRVIIGKDGTVKKPIVEESLSPECDEEALRIIGLMPSWIPGKQAGDRVPVLYYIKIPFILKRNNKADT